MHPQKRIVQGLWCSVWFCRSSSSQRWWHWGLQVPKTPPRSPAPVLAPHGSASSLTLALPTRILDNNRELSCRIQREYMQLKYSCPVEHLAVLLFTHQQGAWKLSVGVPKVFWAEFRLQELEKLLSPNRIFQHLVDSKTPASNSSLTRFLTVPTYTKTHYTHTDL